ncbi:hypothetical protein D9611_000347 [Ephemerocybe angulata]|uniref:Uncharacterized protein n=1 Tax=Ephemerocybe angulata TaxID=980116 RepID=A0A8H5BQH1_9AGAR|nr:hypothetical protein D9611_000347 [Tulosesus angulatus]
MPASPSALVFDTTPIERRTPVSSSEAASLGGKPAKTPIIAGSVCGGVLFIAWVIGFAVYFRKRQNRKKRKRAAEEGLCDPPPEKLAPTRSTSERIVIPPDPAILLGYAKPGDVMHPAASRHNSDSDSPKHKHPGHSRSVSSHSAKQPLPTPSRPVPLKSHSAQNHKRSHSSSKSRPSSPKKAQTGIDDEMTVPLNPLPSEP